MQANRKATTKPTLVVSNKPATIVTRIKNKDEQYGLAIMKSIDSDQLLNEVDYFTREALLTHLRDSPAFGRVSTATRIEFIRLGVNWLLRQDMLIRANDSRVYLCLPRKQNRALRVINNPVPAHMKYYEHVRSMIRSNYPVGHSVSVMPVVWLWSTNFSTIGEAMTEDARRAIIRKCLTAMSTKTRKTQTTMGALNLFDLEPKSDYTYVTLPPLYL